MGNAFEPAAPVTARAVPPSQLLCRCGGHACPTGGCDHKDRDDYDSQSAATASTPGTVRRAFEAALAHDFSKVRIHSDAGESPSSDRVGPIVYTLSSTGGERGPQLPDDAGPKLLSSALMRMTEPGRAGEDERTGGVLQRAPAGSPAAASTTSVQEVLASPGEPIDAPIRADMEARFGHDFSKVRIHSDARATRSAEAVGALAYTVGSHVVFRGGAYPPTSPESRRLLAHELVHVLQQRSSSEATPPPSHGEERPRRAPVTPSSLGRRVVARQADPPYPGAISRCRAMGVPCPAPHFHHGTVCRLVDCSRAATARLPFAISPGICIYHCIDGSVCTCVLLGTSTSAVCVITLCSGRGGPVSQGEQDDLVDRAVAAAANMARPAADGGGEGESLQAKLAMSTPGDLYEREADSIADRVMSSGPAEGGCSCCSGTCGAKERPEKLLVPSMGSGLAIMRQTPRATPQSRIQDAMRAAAIRIQIARFRVQGIGPPSPRPGQPGLAETEQARARRLAQMMFEWPDPNMEQIADILGDMAARLAGGRTPTVVAPASDRNCGPRSAYVVNFRPPIHLCPQFFQSSTEQQIRTMVHEAAHLARIGQSDLGEGYCTFFDCGGPCPGGFDSADSWAHFVNCLSDQPPDRPPPIIVRPPPRPGGGQPQQPAPRGR